MTSWTTRANDRSLEYLILLGRLVSVVAGLGVFVFALVASWAREGHTRDAALGSLAVCFGVAITVGLLSWVAYGNEEWRGAPPVVDGARWGDLQCNVQLGSDGKHPGEHWDSRLDPKKVHLWS